MGELRGGISPPPAPKTVREPLDSHGFRCSASDIHEPPNVIAPNHSVWVQLARGPATLNRHAMKEGDGVG